MRYRLLGASGLRVSELCLGTATFGEEGWGSNADESRQIVDAYIDAGGSFIDVANVYAGGRSEEILGEIIAGRRDQLVIGTKFTATIRPGDPNAWGNHRKSIRQSLHRSLRSLKTDYVDILWMHCWDELTPLDELMRTLDDEVTAGNVLYVGVSNTPAWATARATTIAELRGWTRFVGLQAEYSLVSRTPELDQIPMAQHLGLGMLAWSPLGGGLLAGGYGSKAVSGKRFVRDAVPARRLEIAAQVCAIAEEIGEHPAAVAMAWVKQRPFPVIPILGSRTLPQLHDLLAWHRLRLDESVVRRLDELSKPTPIMPGEGLQMPGVGEYFHAGSRDDLLD